MKSLLTPHQVAKVIGVSESSLKRWCDKGILPTRRTAGGHRRVELEAVLRFVRQTGHMIEQPELVGLPAAIGKGPIVIERAKGQLCEALVTGDEAIARRILLDLYFAKHTVAEVGDRVISPAMAEIGECWSEGSLEVYQERRSCEIMSRVLHEWRTLCDLPSPTAPRALGAAVEADAYMLPTSLVELTLREIGWQADSYGTLLPFETLGSAVRDVRPALCWVSVSYVADEAAFCAGFAQLLQTAREVGTAVVVGGAALTDSLRKQLPHCAFCDHLAHLVAFANTVAIPVTNSTPVTNTSPVEE